MYRILINAYAVCPGMGSEPGMGWNWCVNLAKHCELHIITEGEFREQIEKVVAALPQKENMHFYYNPVPDDIRRMCWNQGDWRFYKYYKEWQWKTYQIAKEICENTHIDVLHQLNMIGFREPGYLWKLSKEKNIPLVWGPIDAKDKFPMNYASDANIKTKAFLLLKNFLTCLQLKYSRRVKTMAKQSSVIVAASSNSVNSLKKHIGVDSVLLNETGCLNNYAIVPENTRHEFIDLLWVGKMDFRKQLDLAIKSVANANNPKIRLHIAGGGNDSKYKVLAKELGVESQCVWYGAVSHEKVQLLMQESDLLFFTSVAEGTPHVVLEAIANNLPIICFDTCGQGDSVNETVGIKIPLTNPKQSIKDFAKAINFLNENREELKRMSGNCKERKEELSWDNKIKQMVGLYEEVMVKG